MAHPEYEQPVAEEDITALADGLVSLIPWLRFMNAADEQSWLQLHLAVTERGGFTPVEASILQQVANGLLPHALRGEELE